MHIGARARCPASPPPPNVPSTAKTYFFELVVAGTVEAVQASETAIKTSIAVKAGVSVDKVSVAFRAGSVIVAVTIAADDAAELAAITAKVDPLLADTSTAATLVGPSVAVESIRSTPPSSGWRWPECRRHRRHRRRGQCRARTWRARLLVLQSE